jgi:CubicO group peptidase (beta-lactamase class C family)
MPFFLWSFQSELLKLRRSPALWLTLIGGLFIPLVIVATRLLYVEKTLLENASDGVWLKLFNQCWQYMSIMLLPLGITLVASLITQIEFHNNAWKQVFASPQRLSLIFWVKYGVVLLILVLFFLLFNLGVFLTGAVPAVVFQAVPYPQEAFPVADIVKNNARFFVNCLPVLAGQYLLSLHIRNFIVPIGIGFILVVASLIAISWHFGYVIPYTYCALQYLGRDSKISTSVNLQAWAWGYFWLFTLVNYGLFVVRNQTVRFVWPGKLRAVAGVLIALGLVGAGWAMYANRNREPSPVLADPTAIRQRIAYFEENMGFVKFKISGQALTSVQERMRNYGIRGLSLAVIHNYRIEWAKAYGWADQEARIALTTDTRFQPGSISKSLNALAFWRLYQTKRINFFADINTYLTTWQFPYNQAITHGKKITIAQLLSHSAGLNIHGFGFQGYSRTQLLPTTLQIVKGEKPARNEAVRSLTEPLLRYEYSGGGTMLSQLILEDVTRQPYANYLDGQVLQPLGMTRSSFNQPPAFGTNAPIATGYTIMNQGGALREKHTLQPEQAAAGLWTTPTDLAKMVINIQRSLRGDTDALLTKQTARLMLTPYNDAAASMGFFIDDKNGTAYFQHGAGNPGYSGKFMGSMVGGNGVVVLVNSDDDAAVSEEVIQSIAQCYEWAGFDKVRTPIVRPAVALAKPLKAKYVGAYRLDNSVLTITEQAGQLWLRASDNPWPMHFTDHQSFINIESKSEKRFSFDQAGKVVALSILPEVGAMLTAKRVRAIRLSEAEQAVYVGQYRESTQEIARIVRKEGELWLISENAIAPMPLQFLTKTEFYLAENGGIFTFERNKAGQLLGVKAKNQSPNQFFLRRLF